MPKILVLTDDDKLVETFVLPSGHIGNSVWRDLTGRYDTPMGGLGRAIEDAQKIERGIDPERPSEKAMRLTMERKREREAT